MFEKGDRGFHLHDKPFSHAKTPEYIQENDAAILSFLQQEGVDVEYALSLGADHKSKYLIDRLLGDERQPASVHHEISPEDEEVGMILIKPEIFPCADQVINFLASFGIESRLLEPRLPSKHTWLNTYGYMLDKHPDVINIYITQRALGLCPVIFRHLTIDEYENINSVEVRASDGDKDKMFDAIFCGEASDASVNTLRGTIALPAMKQLGFDDFTNYASSFDPVDYFKEKRQKTYRAFNGIHVPSDRSEKQKNMIDFVK